MLPPLTFDMDGWIRLAVDSSAEELRLHGPIAYVSLQTEPSDGGMGMKLDNLVAIFDTGAGHSCISPRLAAQFGLPDGEMMQHAAGRKSENVPVYRCRVFYPVPIDAVAEFAVLSHLVEPMDVVIGCDLLSTARVIVDFTTGRWEAHFKMP